MTKAEAEHLFDFLKNLLYSPQQAVLDEKLFTPESQDLREGLLVLKEYILENRDLGLAIARGDLSVEAPPVENTIAASLKAIQGSLRHLSWQTQQVAKGDYDQKVDFMGEFSQAFNTMTQQLKERQNALLKEKERTEEQNEQLRRSQELMMTLTMDSHDLMIVEAQGKVLFCNTIARRMEEKTPESFHKILKALEGCTQESAESHKLWETELVYESVGISKKIYLGILSYAVRWEGKKAKAHIVKDQTEMKQEAQRMQDMIYRDVLTGLYNRRYGMQILESLEQQKKSAVIAFVDMDHLKYCNDVFGHEEGDRYIQKVANLLSHLPEPKLVCRVGGDEFMIIREGKEWEKLEQDLLFRREVLMEQEGARHEESFSIGCALMEEGVPSTSEVLALADQRMYEYKFAHKKGRPKEEITETTK